MRLAHALLDENARRIASEIERRDARLESLLSQVRLVGCMVAEPRRIARGRGQIGAMVLLRVRLGLCVSERRAQFRGSMELLPSLGGRVRSWTSRIPRMPRGARQPLQRRALDAPRVRRAAAPFPGGRLGAPRAQRGRSARPFEPAPRGDLRLVGPGRTATDHREGPVRREPRFRIRRADGRHLAREGAEDRAGRASASVRPRGDRPPDTLSTWQRGATGACGSSSSRPRTVTAWTSASTPATRGGDGRRPRDAARVGGHRPPRHGPAAPARDRPGRDSDGRTLFLPRHYVAHGIRERSQHAATQTLGLRGPRDHALALERAVVARHYGLLDAALDRRKSAERTVSFDDPVPGSVERRELRVAMIRRLQFLEPLELAERTGKRTWRLSADHGPALRQMQLARDLQRSAVSRDGRRLVDPSARQRLSVLEPGTLVRGRWAGLARDEARDAPYWVVEGPDGITHFVPEHPLLALSRSEDRVQQGELVTLTGRSRESEGLVVSWVRVARQVRSSTRAGQVAIGPSSTGRRCARSSRAATLRSPASVRRQASRRGTARRSAARIDGLERAGLLRAGGTEPEIEAQSRDPDAAQRAMARFPRDIDRDLAMPRWARELDEGPSHARRASPAG